MAVTPPLRVLVTGADGNLGRKIVAHLLAGPGCGGVVALDLAFRPDAPEDERLRRVTLDLARPSRALDAAFEEVDAVVHLAAQNPYPDASWEDGAVSLDMTLNAVDAFARAGGGAGRFVFASSNHVMGGYKEEELAPGSLTTALPPRPGTRSGAGDVPRAYAAAKLMGERVMASRAGAAPGAGGRGLTAVSLRIGWCQPGANHPATLSASGVPGEGPPADADAARDLRWFRSMWLSDRDYAAAVSAALVADASSWPAPAIVVNAMSDNAGMPWDLSAPRAQLGYAPRDDVWRALGTAPGPSA